MIKYFFRYLLLVLCFLNWGMPLSAQPTFQDIIFADRDNMIICPGTLSDKKPPNFLQADCWQGAIENIDPQGKILWLKALVSLPKLTGENGSPLSVFIAGKMSSEVYLNGQFVGQNGVIGDSIATEKPGKMDAELFPPQQFFHLGENEIVLRVSSYHGVMHLARPIHAIAIGSTRISTQYALPHLVIALVTLGVFGLAGLYFGVMAMISQDRSSLIILSLICLFAAGQLLSETLRNLVQYSYPIHEYRLIAIALFSTAFGVSVTFLTLRAFMRRYLMHVMIVTVALCLFNLILIPGFDYKALGGMIIPLFISLLITGFWAYKRKTHALGYFLSIFVFIVAIFVFRSVFLDTVFFLLVALFLLVLFANQALMHAAEAQARRNEQARADRLEHALAEAKERVETSYISVKNAGKVERVATNEIVHCKGASGYTEITLTDGRILLHAMSLNAMEDALPTTFLRVHRSHLVNVAFVKSLSREGSGVGTLLLNENSTIPVSRRIMPKVRQALG